MENILKDIRVVSVFLDDIKITATNEYCGYIIDKFGIHKLKHKIDAMGNAKIPTNKIEVRAFAGLVNYYDRFLENLSSTLYPVYNLLKKEVQFKLDRKCQRAFDIIKKENSSDRVLG